MRDLMLTIHFLGLGMGLGTSFAFMFLGIAGSKMEKNEGQRFILNTFAISRMGHIGLILLILSGIFLMPPFWSNLFSFPMLIIKLVLVVILTVLILMINSAEKKAQKTDPETHLNTTKVLGSIVLLVSSVIVILAVYHFH